MFKYILKRLGATVIVVLVVSLIAFFLLRLAPGNPARMMLPDDATEEEIAAMEVRLGLDKSVYLQYFIWFGNVLRGDFGTSINYSRPCISVILERLPNTLFMALMGSIVAIIIAIPLGIIAGVHQGTGLDLGCMFFALIFQSMSTVWLAVFLVLVFAVKLHWLPAFGVGGFKYVILPALTIGLPQAANTCRMARSGMVDVLREDYIVATRARGIRDSVINVKYAFKNALIPVITLVGGSVAAYLGGAIVTEQIFNWPGMGQLMSMSINNRDYPMVQAILLVTATGIALVHLAIDLINSAVDRRIVFSSK